MVFLSLSLPLVGLKRRIKRKPEPQDYSIMFVECVFCS